MNDKFNISFKRDERETGLSGIGNPHRGSTIKVNKIPIGNIFAPNWQSKDNKFRVSLMVNKPDGNWGWVTFRKRFDSDGEAREFVKEVLPNHDIRNQLYYEEQS